MNNAIPLEYSKYYHVYNHGINSCELFSEKANYEYFLRLYDKYIPLIADTYAWCLMGNHFHLLVRIKEEEEMKYLPPKILNPDRSERPCQVAGRNDPSGSERPDGVLYTKKMPLPERQFGHLCNAYTKAFNKKYKRTGSLFESPFRRKEITNENYFKYLIYYIHHNPVHHGFTEDMIEYPWSSYLTILSPKKTQLKRQEIIEWFDDKENFKYFHKQQHELDNIKDLLIDD